LAQVSPSARSRALALKVAVTTVGAVGILLALFYIYDELVAVESGRGGNLGGAVLILASFAVAMSSTALATSIPESVRARFRVRIRKPQSRPVYGFVTILAVGIGSTLGSPLFILIPLNILQYELVSLGSLLLATVLSVLMAKVYADMYSFAGPGSEAVGGPSFTRLACGVRSVRYFVSRVSMWIANTALAAYSKLVFVIFDLEIFPDILARFGVGSPASTVIVYTIAIVFIGWSVANAIFERRIIRSIGYLQVVLTSVMVFILVYQSLLLGAKGAWNLSGITALSSGNWVFALVVNTGYLYLLFFGFQEIQALERDVHSETKIPIISRIRRGYRMKKARYLGVAMILSVVVAAVVNILYALAVFSLHPSLATLRVQQIPALFLANNYLGPSQELLMAIAFLVATITTFVPAFMAASRHLGALAEDGYIPRSLSNVSWVFTLVAIFLLAEGNASFLVEITDFLVLISLGIISLSAIWLRKSVFDGRNVLPLIVGGSCFVAGAGIYFISSGVVVFGIASLAFTYLIFDIAELGVFGTQLFLAVFNLTCVVLLWLFSGGTNLAGALLNSVGIQGGQMVPILSYLLLITSATLFLNLIVDIRILERTAGRPTR
jgi:amino acid transporter